MSELRPSFEERDRYLDLLSQSYANGRLDDEEFARRSQGVLGAVTHRDALAFFEGLPQPNLVPTQPPPPPRPAVYHPAVAAPQQRPSGDLTRRTLIGAGVGLGLLALVGVFGVTARVDDATGEFPVMPPEGVPWEEYSLTMDGIFVDGVAGAAASLAEQGLTEVGEFHVTREAITGRAAPQGAGHVVDFTSEPRGALVTVPGTGTMSRTVPVDRLDALVQLALESSTGQLSGDVTDVELRWDASQGPVVRVTATDGHRTSLVDVAESGDVIYWEENQ